MTNTTSRFEVVYDVLEERKRQDEKWGEQNHPDGTGASAALGFDIREDDSFAFLAEQFTWRTDTLFEIGSGTWRDILLEEIFEAMAEDDPEKLTTELIQSAAVIVAWIEAIRRRNA